MQIGRLTRRRRQIAVIGLGVLAVAVLAMPQSVAAKKATSLEAAENCGSDPTAKTIDATYEWSGFAPARQARITFVDETTGVSESSTQLAERSGSFFASRSANTHVGDTYHVEAELLNAKGDVIRGSEEVSTSFLIESCN